MDVSHQLNIVYDKDEDAYSFDDITSAIINIDDKENLFDYDLEYAKSINQGNKKITNKDNGEWFLLPSSYLDAILGKNSHSNDNMIFPSNIRSLKNIKKY